MQVEERLFMQKEPEWKKQKNKKHNIEIIVDRLVIKPEIASRLSDSKRNP